MSIIVIIPIFCIIYITKIVKLIQKVNFMIIILIKKVNFNTFVIKLIKKAMHRMIHGCQRVRLTRSYK